MNLTEETPRVSKYSTTSAIPINHKSYFGRENSSELEVFSKWKQRYCYRTSIIALTPHFMQDKLRLNLMVHFTRVETFVTSLRNVILIFDCKIWTFRYGKTNWVNKEFWGGGCSKWWWRRSWMFWFLVFFPTLIKQIDPLKPNGERVQMSILTELLNDVV